MKDNKFLEYNINNIPKFFTTGEVSERMDEPSSTIRFWADQFEKFLNIERTGKKGTRRQFGEEDIKKLEYIKHLLKEENLSIKQVKDFLTSSNNDISIGSSYEKEQVIMGAIAKAISSEIDDKFNENFIKLEETLLKIAKIEGLAQKEFKSNIMKHFEEINLKTRIETQENIKYVANRINQDLIKENENISIKLLELEERFIKREEKILETLDETKKELDAERSRSLLNRIFGKR